MALASWYPWCYGIIQKQQHSLACCHVLQVRKWSDPVDNGANLLIAVPGKVGSGQM